MPLTPDPEAEQMAESMVGPEARDVMQNILQETLLSAEMGQILESGRTACNDVDALQPPLSRYPTAVDLAGCPVGQKMGIWHTHVTPETLLRPTHSLPDYANVLLGGVDVSVVVGTDQAHVAVAPADRDQAHRVFEDAVGKPVDGPGDVVDLAEDLDAREYQQARERVERALAPLTDRVDTGFGDLRAQVEQLDVEEPAVAAHACMAHADAPTAIDHLQDGGGEEQEAHHHPTADADVCTRFRESSRSCGEAVVGSAQESSINIQGQIVGSAIGIIVGRVVEAVLFPS